MPDTDDAGAPAAAAATRVGKPLTKRESGLLNYLIEYLATNTYQPSLREICRARRLKSTKTASEVIQSLAEKGYVALPDSGSRPARGIRILGVDLTITRTLVPPGAATGPAASPAADE
jgi:SOS-response transcriptional repressor LexA